MNSKNKENNSKSPSVILKKSPRDILVKQEVVPNEVVNGQSNDAINDIVKNDNRIKLTKYFILVMLVIASGGMFAPDKIADETFLVIAMFFILAVTMYVGLLALRNDTVGSLIFSLLSGYILVAYPFKLMIAVNYPEALWVSGGIGGSEVLREEIAGSFITVFPSLVFLLLGLFLFHRMRYVKSGYVITKINHSMFVTVITLIMCIKVYTQVVYNIGMPGVIPTSFPIPYLAGFLALLSKHVLLAVVNLYFYYTIRLNDRKKILVALMFLLINVALTLRVGSKGEMVIQGLLLIYYYFDAYRYLSKTIRKFILIITASMVVFVVMVYPLVNYYRDSILTGSDFSEAVETAQKYSGSDTKSFSFSFIDRVNGVSEFYAATKLGEGRAFGFETIFNNDVMDLFKEKLYGPASNKAITAFSATYFSVFYLVGGGLLLVVSGFVAGWVIRWNLMFIRFKVFKSSFTFYAYLPLVCILWVRVLAAGGNLALPMKQLLLEVIFLFLLERYATKGK